MKPTLTNADYQRAATALGCDVAAIIAVCTVEAPRGGFLASGAPTILFERHQFSKRTGSRYDLEYPDISNRTPGGYRGGEAEHARLVRAVALDRNAALMSASWGKFQIMGFNFSTAGFPTLQAFINAMHESEAAQLDAFVSFIQREGMASMLKFKQWADFAKRYNGPNFAINKYDSKLASAYTAAGCA